MIEIRGRNRHFNARGGGNWEEVKQKRMRKNLALFLVALVALTLVVAAYGCGGSKPAENTGAEGTPATETQAPADTGMGMHDSTAAMPADTTAK
jgi:hypothetical protein